MIVLMDVLLEARMSIGIDDDGSLDLHAKSCGGFLHLIAVTEQNGDCEFLFQQHVARAKDLLVVALR